MTGSDIASTTPAHAAPAQSTPLGALAPGATGRWAVLPVPAATPRPDKPEDAARRAHNAARLTELYPAFAHRIDAILTDLEAEGWSPRIATAWRARAGAQDRYNLHHVTGRGGRKEALAVELAADDAGSEPAHRRFLMALAAIARRRGCQTGILDGLAEDDAGTLIAAIDHRDDETTLDFGTAPARVSPIGITAAEARAGKRVG